jgi:hypothetical protein
MLSYKRMLMYINFAFFCLLFTDKKLDKMKLQFARVATLEDHSLSAIHDSLFNTFAPTFLPAVSYIRNLRALHAVVLKPTGNQNSTT